MTLWVLLALPVLLTAGYALYRRFNGPIGDSARAST